MLSPEIEELISPEPNTGCWLWLGSVTYKDYGKLMVNRKNRPAHRLVYEQLVGPIPEGLTIDHLCRVRSCVNPDHMEPVTAAENVLRGVGPTAENKRKTLCKHGHPLTKSHRRDSDWRYCRTCSNDAKKRLRQRQKLASLEEGKP